MPIFHEDELEVEYELLKDNLPTINDVLKYVLSRKGDRNIRVRDLANKVVKLWDKADCCPHSILRVSQIYSGIHDKYLAFLKKSGNKSHRKRPATSPPQEPSRRSSRLPTKTITSEAPLQAFSESSEFTPSPKSTRSNPDHHHLVRESWDAEFGTKLFNVHSKDRVAEVVKNGGAFDRPFYDDQCGPRTLVMQIRKVTDEFKESENKRLRKEARQYVREISARGDKMFKLVSFDDEIVDENTTDIDFPDYSYNEYHKTSIIRTRDQTMKLRELQPITMCDKSIQVDDLSMQTPVRMFEKTKNTEHRVRANNTSAHPKYLQAMSLLMAEGLSAAEAVKAVYVIDTVVWGQVRFLPLELDKDYINMHGKLKKLSGSNLLNEVENDTEVAVEVSLITENNASEGVVDEDTDAKKSKMVEFLTREIRKKKAVYADNAMSILPGLRTIRRNHHLLAVYVEKRIGEQLVEHGGFCIPDGTTRNKVGEISALIIKVNGKMRAMKAQRIGKGDRATWAEVLLHMLKRLTVASGNSIMSIWESIKTMLSDLCKVNKNLASEISKLIGSDWIPGQLFCVLHYVLAIPESIKAMFTMYQGQIGRDKLFPETTGFEMNINDKTVVVQILDVWMRLTSIRWHGRMWNRYSDFTTFAEKHGVRNVGHMIHANRFGEFEERCAGGVYLSETWSLWLESYQDVRNTLSCYLRTVNGLMEICIFQWATAALVGLHITVPFMSMLLDHKATQRELLDILPRLYTDLESYTTSLIKFDGPAVKALEPFWQAPFEKNTSPYGVDVMKALQDYTNDCDKETMDMSLKDMCSHMAATLKRQRGDAYGFGDNEDSDEHITKNISPDMMDDPDATHSKPVENYFGNLDRYVSKTGPQGFDKVTDDLVLKYGKDLITESEYEWRSKENRESAKRLKVMQSIFNEGQDKLRVSGCSNSDIAAITTMNKIQRVVMQCKKNHGGPIVSKEELDEIIASTKDVKKLSKALDLEIRYRKFTMTKVKNDCPLFQQRKLTVDKKIENIHLLMDSQELGLKALATMEDLVTAIHRSDDADNNTNEAEIDDVPLQDTVDIATTDEAVNILSMRLSSQDTLSKDDFILGMFVDGFYPGQVLKDCGEAVDAIFMTEATIQGMPKSLMWKWPSTTDRQLMRKVCILKIRPNMDLAREYSTRRCVVYKLMNLELVQKFVV